jgi:hypothetical protein
MSGAIPTGVSPDAIRDAAVRLDAGEQHPFGIATAYEAVVNGKRYPPKALIGVAARHHLGLELGPDDFRGGERTGEANWYLRKLGFEVVSKEPRVGEDWTDDEICAAIDVYFDMLLRRLNGEEFVRVTFLRSLAGRTHGRSVKSVEYKLQNVSAVLIEMGLTRLDGFAPASNFQTKLGELVDEYLRLNPEIVVALESSLEQPPSRPPVPSVRSEIEEDPPAADAGEPKRPRRFHARKVTDRALRDAANRALGRSGEQFVVGLEQESLRRSGRADLADKVRWVADELGDGAGYDVGSFEPDGEEIYIEVKTTNGAKETPFLVTANEIELSRQRPGFRLYRVFNFKNDPRMYVLRGALGDAARLEPVLFRARVGSSPRKPG